MSKPTNATNSDTRDTSVQNATDKGAVNTQQKDGGLARADKSAIDQSEGSHHDGQATGNHGQGAGFSRNVH